MILDRSSLGRVRICTFICMNGVTRLRPISSKSFPRMILFSKFWFDAWMTWAFMPTVFKKQKKITKGHRRIFLDTEYKLHIWSVVSTPPPLFFSCNLLLSQTFSPVASSIVGASCIDDSNITFLFNLGVVILLSSKPNKLEWLFCYKLWWYFTFVFLESSNWCYFFCPHASVTGLIWSVIYFRLT